METKTCPMCCSEIPEAARKCAQCHHFQSRAVMLLFHPATAGIVFALPMIVLFIVMAKIFERGEPFELYQGQIVVTNTEVAFGEMKNGPTVAVLGEIQNQSAVPWEEINLHAHFTDASGRTIDVASEEKYSYHLPANATSPFKLSFRREFPETNYARHTVRVRSAKDARARW
jgi:hypothetical protein